MERLRVRGVRGALIQAGRAVAVRQRRLRRRRPERLQLDLGLDEDERPVLPLLLEHGLPGGLGGGLRRGGPRLEKRELRHQQNRDDDQEVNDDGDEDALACG